MLRQLFAFGFAIVAWNATAETVSIENPFEAIIALEIEKMELEFELFGEPTDHDAIFPIQSIVVYDLEEELELDFDTTDYLPEDFDAKAGMETIDWSEINLYELEEEIDLGFNTKDYLPKGFNPYEGMSSQSPIMLSSRL
ncbi:MAG: hypothetical protein HKN00_00155 [Flavobacteriaceae bacterium]|nr:hypothetical protein [Bacteroidia bacterium]MBT8286532.1 hypothetical protein [Bacteroidia bacterium]NNF73566.1 hypothetical protein [Flavobacteriaceae bacterium]NNK73106.1 hypothetical protein [Flavobacteriaceae bacterium]